MATAPQTRGNRDRRVIILPELLSYFTCISCGISKLGTRLNVLLQASFPPAFHGRVVLRLGEKTMRMFTSLIPTETCSTLSATLTVILLSGQSICLIPAL